MGELTPRQSAQRIEEFGSDLQRLIREFDADVCKLDTDHLNALNVIPKSQYLDDIARAITALGDRLCAGLDRDDEAEASIA